MGRELRAAENVDHSTIPSLPPRLAALAGAVGTVQHPGQPVRHHLQIGWAMSDLERREAVSLLSTLTSSLDPTASFGGEDGHAAKGALLTKMIYGLAGPAQQSDVAASSKMEMYADAIEDLPAWAIDAAIKRWARGGCPASVEENPRYAFPPAPATLRGMAKFDMDVPERNARLLKNLVEAIPMDRALDPEPLPRSTAVSPLRRM